MKYVKKPIPIEAVQWLKPGDHPEVVRCDCVEQTAKMAGKGGCICDYCGKDFIRGREGKHIVTSGCWILGPGAEGEFWAVQNSIFFKTYAPAE